MSRRTAPPLWFQPCPWIDGEFLPLANGLRRTIRNPATQAPLTEVTEADTPTVEMAIAGANRAQKVWKVRPAAERGEILKRVAQLFLARADTLARLLTAEQGKPYAQAMAEVEYAASFYQWFGEEARRICGRIAPHPLPGREYLIEQKPAGVAGLITPWNFPSDKRPKKLPQPSLLVAPWCGNRPPQHR